MIAGEQVALLIALAAPLQDAWQAILALGGFALFYRALGEPGSGWGRDRRDMARRSFFALLGALIVFQSSAALMPGAAHPGSGGRAFQSYTTGVMGLRNRFLQERVRIPSPGGDSIDGVARLQRAVELAPENLHYRRMLGVSQAEQGDYAAALKTLHEAADRSAVLAPNRAAREKALWTELYGPTRPSPERLQELENEVGEYVIGWAGRVAVLAAWRRLDTHPAQAALEAEVVRDAEAWMHTLFTGVFTVVLLVPQMALIVAAVSVVLIRRRVLRGQSPSGGTVGFVLWEGFILMLVSGNLIGWLGLPRLSAEAAPGAIALRIVLVDVLQVAAFGYLWWRLRRTGHGLAEVGITRRNLGADIAVGLAAAVLLVPTAFLINLVTASLSERLFPQAPPAYHPLAGWTASSGIEIRLALFSAAVIGAPLMEEIFFRGAMFGALRRRFGVGAGILVSSAVFAILHPQLPLGFLPIAALGAAFAGLYAWRNSLTPGIVAHAVNNGLAFLMLNLYFPQNN